MKYNFSEIQLLINEGNSYRSLKKLLGISSATLWKAQKKGLIFFPKNNQKRLIDLGIIKGHPCSNNHKENLSKLMSERITRNIRFSKMEKYKDIWLDSSYESILARELDKHNIKWTRPKSVKWDDNGQIRRYIPDFYLPEYNVYLDPKNDFLITRDQRKIKLAEQFNNIIVIILNKNQLRWDYILEKIINTQ